MAAAPAPAGYGRLLDSALAIVASFVGSFILSLIRSHPQFELVATAVILGYLIYAALDSWFRTTLRRARENQVRLRGTEKRLVEFIDANKGWTKFAHRVLVFVLLTGVFLVAQIFLVFLRRALADSNLNTFESSAFLAVTIAFFIWLFVTYQQLSEPLNSRNANGD